MFFMNKKILIFVLVVIAVLSWYFFKDPEVTPVVESPTKVNEDYKEFKDMTTDKCYNEDEVEVVCKG